MKFEEEKQNKTIITNIKGCSEGGEFRYVFVY